jgi:hypothetical protein
LHRRPRGGGHRARLPRLAPDRTLRLADEFFIDRRGPGRPRKITDAELVCLAVAQVLLDCPGDRKFLAWARWRLGHLFPYLPKQPGYNKRIRALAPQVARLLNLLIFESTSIHDEQRRPALMRPSKVMSKAFRAAFQRLDQLPFAVAVGGFGRVDHPPAPRPAASPKCAQTTPPVIGTANIRPYAPGI